MLQNEMGKTFAGMKVKLREYETGRGYLNIPCNEGEEELVTVLTVYKGERPCHEVLADLVDIATKDGNSKELLDLIAVLKHPNQANLQ